MKSEIENGVRPAPAPRGACGCDEGRQMLGWRKVSVESGAPDELARQLEPVVHQIFIGPGAGINETGPDERKLFVIRKVIEKSVRKLGLSRASRSHIPGLSSRTLVCKRMLLADPTV